MEKFFIYWVILATVVSCVEKRTQQGVRAEKGEVFAKADSIHISDTHFNSFDRVFYFHAKLHVLPKVKISQKKNFYIKFEKETTERARKNISSFLLVTPDAMFWSTYNDSTFRFFGINKNECRLFIEGREFWQEINLRDRNYDSICISKSFYTYKEDCCAYSFLDSLTKNDSIKIKFSSAGCFSRTEEYADIFFENKILVVRFNENGVLKKYKLQKKNQISEFQKIENSICAKDYSEFTISSDAHYEVITIRFRNKVKFIDERGGVFYNFKKSMNNQAKLSKHLLKNTVFRTRLGISSVKNTGGGGTDCKKHDINPEKWLVYVINHIQDTKMSELKNLLPQFFDKNLLI